VSNPESSNTFLLERTAPIVMLKASELSLNRQNERVAKRSILPSSRSFDLILDPGIKYSSFNRNRSDIQETLRR
jgi:hypothetical protein